VVTASVVIFRLFVVLSYNWLVGWGLGRVLLLGTGFLFLIFQSQDSLLDLESFPIEVRVKVLLKVDRHSPRLLGAFYVFGLSLCQVSLRCRHLVDGTARCYPALLGELGLVHFVRLLLKHHFFTHLLVLFSVKVLV